MCTLFLILLLLFFLFYFFFLWLYFSEKKSVLVKKNYGQQENWKHMFYEGKMKER